MDQDSLKRIQLNAVKLVDNINVNNGLCDHLFQMGVLDDEEYELVTSSFGQTTKGQVRHLIKILRQKQVFLQFCNALRSSGYDFLANSLENCDIGSVSLDETDSPEKNKIKMLDKITEQTQLLIAIRDDHMSKISQLEEENKKLKEEQGKTVKAVNRLGIVDESFINMFVFSNANKSTRATGDMHAPQLPCADVRQLTQTWELLTACRLSVDVVHYVIAIGAKRTPQEPFNDVAVSLRLIIDTIVSNKKYTAVFEKAIQNLDIGEITGFGTLSAIADELIVKGKWNWGRVITWYAFCAYIACGFKATNLETLDMYGTYIWFFLNHRYSKEICDVGGWVSI